LVLRRRGSMSCPAQASRFPAGTRRLKGHYEGNSEGRSTQAGCSEWRNWGLGGDVGGANGGGGANCGARQVMGDAGVIGEVRVPHSLKYEWQPQRGAVWWFGLLRVCRDPSRGHGFPPYQCVSSRLIQNLPGSPAAPPVLHLARSPFWRQVPVFQVQFSGMDGRLI
jgi:hypothetical protein